jgi:hypothetical protein
MTSQTTLTRIKDAINRFPELRGCRIGFHGNLRSVMIDNGNPNSPNYRIIIIIEEPEVDLGLSFVPKTSSVVLPQPARVLNRTVVGAELLGAGISCGLTVASGVMMAGATAAEIPTAGTSTILVVASWTGLVTQGLQCVNGLGRVIEAARNLDDYSLQRWDSVAWYSNTVLAIDGLGVISGVVGLGGTAATVRRMLTLKGALPAEEAMVKMTNAERIQAYHDSIMKISKSPSAAAELDEILKPLGKRTIDRMQKGNEVIIRRSMVTVSKLVSQRTLNELTKSAKEIILTSAGITASAMPAQYVGSASGSVNWAGDKARNIVINIITER